MCDNFNPHGYVAIYGWKNIAKMFGVSEKKMREYRHELVEKGVVWVTIKQTHPRQRYAAFPAALVAWITDRSAGRVIF